MLQRVKTALRITHDKLDDDLLAKILAAKTEMQRVGVDPYAIADEGPLVVEAIKTFCQWQYNDDEKKRAGFQKSWETQIDALRKSSGFRRR